MKPGESKELGAGRVAFKARLDAIKREIEAERTVMSVWREYKNLVNISYSQFDRYVNRYIKEKPGREKEGKKAAAETGRKPKAKDGFTINHKLDKDLY